MWQEQKWSKPIPSASYGLDSWWVTRDANTLWDLRIRAIYKSTESIPYQPTYLSFIFGEAEVLR
jgi:hypothetical protein